MAKLIVIIAGSPAFCFHLFPTVTTSGLGGGDPLEGPGGGDQWEGPGGGDQFEGPGGSAVVVEA